MQKLLLAVLTVALFEIVASSPGPGHRYYKQGRRRGDACRLICLMDAITCESPCRLLFRSRSAYISCARDCRRDRVDCFVGCKNIGQQTAATGVEAGTLKAGTTSKSTATVEAGSSTGGAGGSGAGTSGANTSRASISRSNATDGGDDDDDDDHDDDDGEEDTTE